MNRKRVRLPENLKVLRNKNGLTQEQVANIVNISRQGLAKWETGKTSPNVEDAAVLCEIYGVTLDELIYGKMADIITKNEIIDRIKEEYVSEDIIREMTEKGFYDIISDDLEIFYPIRRFDFSRIIGLVAELKERGYHIISVYGNGFSIYFKTDEEANKFPKVLYDIIDAETHCEINTYVCKLGEVDSKLFSIESEVLDEVNKSIYGQSIDDMYYWVDELDRIRGYGVTKEVCEKQAEEQGCSEYTVLHE